MTAIKDRATLKQVVTWWGVVVITVMLICGWAVMAYSAPQTKTLEHAFNVHPGMKMSRDVPGLGNRLFTYKRIESRGRDEYAVVFTMKRW